MCRTFGTLHDCLVEIVVTDRADLLTLTMVQLPQVDGVVGSSSEVVLCRFATGVGWNPQLLDPPAVAALGSGRMDRWDQAQPSSPAPELSAVDERLALALTENSRIRWGELAERVGVMQSTARRRATNLFRSGALRLRTVVEPEALGLPVTTFLWLRVDPGRVNVVAQQLVSRDPAVVTLIDGACWFWHGALCGTGR